MSVRKFKFVSPGVFINEIDNSQLPNVPEPVGPVVIGRTERGPAMRPVQVDSFSEFVEVFGNPIPGGQGGDVWRDGNYTSPTYAPYAAQAWLKNNSPCTVVRLLGSQHSEAAVSGQAGWQTTATVPTAHEGASGGAFGLFIVSSGSIDHVSVGQNRTGSLAAIFYLNEGSVTLSGTMQAFTAGGDGSSDVTSSAATVIKSAGADNTFRVVIRNAANGVVENAVVNFTDTSDRYIRKVMNTNPTLTNSDITSDTKTYWLGETYENMLLSERISHHSASSGRSYGIILALKDANNNFAGGFRQGAQKGSSGWTFAQDLGARDAYNPTAMQKLFRFHTLNDGGEWECRNLKVSIQDIKISSNEFDPYGSFTAVLRRAQDTDGSVEIVERFTGCNLNPNSPNYIAKKIGDQYATWDDLERRYRDYGSYPNNSKFIRVEMNSDVDAGVTNAALLPFGFYGPKRFKGFSLVSGSSTLGPKGFGEVSNDSAVNADLFVRGGGAVPRGHGQDIFASASALFSASFLFPSMPMKTSTSASNLGSPKDTYFGASTAKSRTSSRYNPGYADLVRFIPYLSANNSEDSWVFSLDDIKATGSAHAAHLSGSRLAGTSITAASASYSSVLDRGFDRFTMPLTGGFDGLNIKEKDPFQNTRFSSPTEKTDYAFNSIKQAIDSVKDPEVVECNLMVVPGITQTGLTSHLLTVCEDRGDALAVIDLEGDYVPSHENTSGEVTNAGDVATTVTNLKNRGINSSYGCAYYPWVRIKDTVNGSDLWAPPSIVAVGTFASAEKKSELWFAPAGFTRGGLSEGAAGVPVIGVRQRLTSKDRDKLYEANINPIATFPAEGIVIFGQKTLQVTPSALDRINVRRLLIFVKREISKIAATTLFEQNVRATWNRFIGRCEPLLRSVQSRLGLSDFKIILDETTTTPDLVDRNVMYAKIFLKPARAIEFIAIDFIITDSGASFED